MSPPTWQGRVIDGRYAVEGVLGKGGMGVVLRARHKFTGARVALKMLHPHMKVQGDLAERFLAEARAPAAIGHPGIVTVTDAGMTSEGDFYLVMELLQGSPLRDLERMSLGAVRRIGLDLLSALGAAHAAGFVHRDLKPENVFVTSSGQVKLLDFGIAKVLAQGKIDGGRTAAGAMMGTLSYMSPEQLRDASTVDARADLWAVGVMLYELIAGVLPYRADSVGGMVIAVMTQSPEPVSRHVPNAPPALVGFLANALAREPQHRFQSAAEMAAALASIPVEGDSDLAHLPTSPGIATGSVPLLPPRSATVPAPPRRWLPWAVAGAITAIAAIVAIVVGTGGGSSSDVPASQPIAVAPSPPAPANDDLKTVLHPPPPEPAPPLELPKDTTPPAPPPAPVREPPRDLRSDLQVCTDGCRLLGRCGQRVNADCTTGCAAHPEWAACVRKANDCNAVASCVLASVCNGVGNRGRGSCKDAILCESRCGKDTACACRCAQSASIRHANILLQVNRCAGDCNGDAQCIQRKCADPIARCSVQ